VAQRAREQYSMGKSKASAWKGIVLAGGGSLLRGVDKLITEETGLPVHVANDPITAVALGTGTVLSEIKYLRKVVVPTRVEF
jgi:actin-like ATPase involved in cell morphogenesis